MDDKEMNEGIVLHGRRKIYTAARAITADNVVEEVNRALAFHMENVQEIDYLYWYRRGLQPILGRVKQIRPEINNKVVVNNAETVVTFKNGYFLTKPVSYVSRKETERVVSKVKKLNEYLYTSGKHAADNAVVDWFHTCGVGAIYCDQNDSKDMPVVAYALDPRSAFVVYSLRPGNLPVFGVNIVTDGEKVYADAITEEYIFRLSGTILPEKVKAGSDVFISVYTLDKTEPNYIGKIPIIEYQYNSTRMGAFEPALPLMDAINIAESNRLDAIEQTVQNLMVLYNCELPEEESANSIRQKGLIVLKSTADNRADVKLMSETLDQQQTQTTIDDLYEQMLEKCGVPSSVRDGGSTSDNVGAVYLRSGWAMADTDARNTEDQFREANKLFDDVFTTILRKKGLLDISVADFDICFVRNDMNNLLVKTQAAMNMKELGLSPEIALEKSGLSSDPVNDVEMSRKYIEQKWAEAPKPEDNPADPNNPANNPANMAKAQNVDEPKGGEPDGGETATNAV